MLKSYPLNILKVSPRAQRLGLWDKFSFSLRIAPLIIHMNHFSYPLTVVILELGSQVLSYVKLILLTVACEYTSAS